MSFDKDGDAGTAYALKDAFAQLAEGEGQRVLDMIDDAPPGPVETKWGLGFRKYEECMEYIRAQGIKAPEGGLALPLPYTIYERPTYSVVPSNAVWNDPARAAEAKILCKEEEDTRRRNLFFPQLMRDARRMKITILVFRRTVLSAWISLVFPSLTSSPIVKISTILLKWNACSIQRSNSCS